MTDLRMESVVYMRTRQVLGSKAFSRQMFDWPLPHYWKRFLEVPPHHKEYLPTTVDLVLEVAS